MGEEPRAIKKRMRPRDGVGVTHGWRRTSPQSQYLPGYRVTVAGCPSGEEGRLKPNLTMDRLAKCSPKAAGSRSRLRWEVQDGLHFIELQLRSSDRDSDDQRSQNAHPHLKEQVAALTAATCVSACRKRGD